MKHKKYLFLLTFFPLFLGMGASFYPRKKKPINLDVGYHSSVYKKPTKGLASRGFHAQGNNQFRASSYEKKTKPGLGLSYKKQPIFMLNLLSTQSDQSPPSFNKQVLRENQYASDILKSRLKQFEIKEDKSSRASKDSGIGFREQWAGAPAH